MANIFFDLDGTLLESRPRLYQLFQHIVPSSKLSFDEYWEYKRNKVNHKQILQNVFQYTFDEVTTFEKEWMEKIELSEWITLDKPFEGVTKFLEELKSRHKIYIVTARQFKHGAYNQIERLGWLGIVEKILVTEQVREKNDLIKQEVNVKSNDWLVGDTGKDIQTGKLLGVKTVAVLTGFQNEKTLLEYKPDVIVGKVTELGF